MYNNRIEKFDNAMKLFKKRKYQEAEKLTMSVCGDEIRQMIEEYGEGDYLYLAPIRRRIRVCKRKLK